ncbi:MAG: DUF1573 domain-containing protein [Bacteroidetes bacterium]|jgi:hypothetical protein|nr:DUF1573 domain-containing protein [Bacteroidota bacterium]MDA0938656.1 DUF1573 domain-containing protein [Bacteroidota bacterium]MDA1344845.1 DUF1573 domain-containing protein [Bacteroidota bacterium]
MKKLFLLATLSAFVMTTGCDDSAAKKVNQDNVQATDNGASQSADAPVMTFDKVAHDFGTISEGERVQTTFTFTNTGKSDLIIVDARGSCGCTVPSYPKNTPIPPGGTGEILVSFDSSNKPNMQQKTVTLSANTQSGREMLRIKAMVTPDPVRQKQREDQARARQQSNN